MATNTLTASTSDTFTYHPGEYKCVNIDIRVATDRIEVLEGCKFCTPRATPVFRRVPERDD